MAVMKTKDEPLVGYFIKDVAPTAAEFADANTFAGRVVFRNANYVEIVEKAITAVASELTPREYAHLPRAQRIASYVAEIKQPVAATTVDEDAEPQTVAVTPKGAVVAPKGAAVKA